MSIDNKVKAYESYLTEEEVKNRFSSSNKPFIVKNLTDVYNAGEGIYNIQNLNILNNHERYIIHIDEDDSFRSVISFMDWFDESNVLDIIDRVVDKHVYRDNVERLFSAVLVHLLMKNDFDTAADFVYRIMWYSTNDGEYIQKGFNNINFGLAPIQFNAKIAYLQLLLTKKYPDVILKKRNRLNLLICISDMLKDNLDFMSEESIKRYSNILKHYRSDLKPFTRLPLIKKKDTEKFVDAIESNSHLFFETCSHLSYYWNSDENIEQFRTAYNNDSVRILNDIINIFNSTPNNKILLEERARYFLILNEKCDFMNIMETVMPALKEQLQTAILQKML